MLKLNRNTYKRKRSFVFIQIQHLLKLNKVAKKACNQYLNSNTTLVKVKLIMELKDTVKLMYSNTTLVKVKLFSTAIFAIIHSYSNTTLVKVKFY